MSSLHPVMFVADSIWFGDSREPSAPVSDVVPSLSTFVRASRCSPSLSHLVYKVGT